MAGKSTNELILYKLTQLEKGFDELKNDIKEDYVHRSELNELKNRLTMLEKPVYGVIGLALVSLVGAILTFFIRKP